MHINIDPRASGAASCAVTMLIIQTLSCTTNVTPGDWELILEGWGIGKLVMFMFRVAPCSRSPGQTDEKYEKLSYDGNGET